MQMSLNSTKPNMHVDVRFLNCPLCTTCQYIQSTDQLVWLKRFMLQIIPTPSDRGRSRCSTRHLFACGTLEEWSSFTLSFPLLFAT